MAAPATVNVFNILRDTTGTPIANARVQCVLSINYATVAATGDAIDEIQQTTTSDSTGRYAFTIVPNDLLAPTGTVYTIIEPHRTYQIAPQSANGSPQQTTAANVIVNTPTPLAPAVSNITGPLTITGALTVGGLITAQAGLTITGTLSLPAGSFSMAGPLTLTAAASQLIPGATSFSVRDTANANDNLLVSNAGLVTARAGLVATAGGLTVSAGGAAVTGNSSVTGTLTVSSTINSQTISAAANFTGTVTIATGLTVTSGGAVITAGDVTITAGKLNFAATASQIVPGATSLALRNNANSANNLLLTDAGLATLRNAVSVPPSASGTVPTTSYGSLPVKIDDQLLGATAASITFVNPLPSGFRHLLIEWYARGDTAAASTGIFLRFNNDSAAHYDAEGITVTGTAAVAGQEGLGQTSLQLGTIPASTATANYFGNGEAKAIYYTGAVGNKNVHSRTWYALADTTTNQQTQIFGGKWRTTATAVTRVDLLPGAGNFIAGSLFTLWGIP